MHETSLIEFTLNAVEERAASMGITEVGEIGLVVGELAAVPLLMRTAFSVMKNRRPMFRNTALVIDERPLMLRCSDCGEEFPGGELSDVTCPACGSGSYQIIQGKELLIDYFTPAD